MTRALYLNRIFIGRLLGTLLALAALLQLLDLLDRASDVLQRGGLVDLARYAALRMPSILGRAMPIAMLVAALLTFRRLAMTLEMTALRATGSSVWGVMRILLPVCLLASLAQAALQTTLAPRTERMLVEWFAATDPLVKPDAPPPRRLWMRIGEDVVAVDRVSLDGRQLDGLLVVQRDPQGLTRQRIDATQARWDGEGWMLREVRVLRPADPRPRRQDSLAWPEGPRPADFIELARPTEALAPTRMVAAIQGSRATARAPAYYLVRLHQLAVQLLDPFIMLLLAAPVVYAMPRRGAQAGRPLACLALGLGYLLLGGLLGALGEVSAITAALAAWASPVLFGAIGAALLIQMEEA